MAYLQRWQSNKSSTKPGHIAKITLEEAEGARGHWAEVQPGFRPQVLPRSPAEHSTARIVALAGPAMP